MKKRSKLTMMTAKSLFVDPVTNLEEMANLFMALVALIAEEQPGEIDSYLKALYGAKMLQEIEQNQ